jgi:hypothetical protein
MGSNPEMSPEMRLRICLLATVLALAACGGAEEGTASTAGPGASEESTTVASDDGSGEPAETTAPASNSYAGGTPEVNVDEATIVVGGETFWFTQGPSDICTPDWQGQGMWFRADLRRVDENGDPIEVPGMEGINPAYFVFDHEGSGGPEDQTGIYFFGGVDSSGDAEWGASHLSENGSDVDSVTLDGNRAYGTATFVSSDGDGPVSGTFEVICADD